MLPFASVHHSAFRIRPFPILLLFLGACLLLLGCPPKSPEERVTFIRNQHTISLETWFPKVEEPAAEEVVGEGETIEGESGDEAAPEEGAGESEAAEGVTDAEEVGEGAEAAAEEPVGPETTTIFFDLIVYFSGDEALPGITVELSHADSSGAEKKEWLFYLETPNMVKGEGTQVSVEQEVEGFVEGDQFSVTMAKHVPPEDRSEYREYAEAGS